LKFRTQGKSSKQASSTRRAVTRRIGGCHHAKGLEDLIRFWLGHANKSVTVLYSKLKDDVTFRKKVVEEVGIGFELPAEKVEVAPCCTHTETLSHVG
jgi:hypothetical protein